MQKIALSTYKVTHYNGKTELLNAKTMDEALQNMDIPESESPVTHAIRTQTGAITIVKDDPSTVIVNVYVDPEQSSSGSVATPEFATLHAGDEITLQAFAARGFSFDGWKVDGEIVSKEERYAYTIPEPAMSGDVLNILAEFKEADVQYTVKVEPSEATGAGCAAGPGGTVAPNTEVQLYAVTGETYKFDGWFRNKEELGKNPVLLTNVAPLAKDEESCVFVAKFSLQA